MSKESDIIAKAKADYFSLKGAYKNPYPPASQEFNHYERGWTQSLKYDDGSLLNALNRPAPKLFPTRKVNAQA